MRSQNIALLILLALAIIGCKPKFDVPDADKGDIDASRYVAVGSGITAGYADGALYYEAQENSFANILAEQFKLIGGGEFKIPYVPSSSNGISLIPGNTSSLNAKFMLGMVTDCKGVTSLSPAKLTPTDNYSFFSSSVFGSGPFNNMGVPGAKVFHVDYKGYGSTSGSYYNPFYQRMASNTSNASILSDAVNQNPTFFTLFIGMNDVLDYAMSGATSDSITSLARFDAHIDSIVDALTKNGAKGAIANLPDISTLPHFSTIPYNGLDIGQADVDNLNNLYNPLGIGINFSVGKNAFVISDQLAPLGMRQIHSDEYIVLTAPLDSIKCNGSYGSLIPMPSRFVLTSAEISAIQSAISSYNAKLRSVAQAKGLAFVDVNAFFAKVKAGFSYNGMPMSSEFVKGGVFSLDGIQLNPIGQALLANEFIKAINSTYNSSIPQVNAGKYRGVVFP